MCCGTALRPPGTGAIAFGQVHNPLTSMPPLVVRPSNIRPSTARPQFSPLVPSSNRSRNNKLLTTQNCYCCKTISSRPPIQSVRDGSYFPRSKALRDDMLAGLMAAAPWAWMRAAATSAEWLNISEERRDRGTHRSQPDDNPLPVDMLSHLCSLD